MLRCFLLAACVGVIACGTPVVMPMCTAGRVSSCPCPGTVLTGTQTCDSTGSVLGPCTGCPGDAGVVDVVTDPDVVVGPDVIGPTCNCNGRICGPDSCGAGGAFRCGTCPGAAACSAAGTCPCAPMCSGLDCGPNGCGGQCGACRAGASCTSGRCFPDRPCGSNVCGTDSTGVSCGTCPRGLMCSGGTACAVDPSSFWVITITNGRVSTTDPTTGSAWDNFGGAPDPKVCLTLSGLHQCTVTVSDSFAPVWNTAFPATPAGMLQAGISTEFLDVDTAIDPDDPICASGVITFRTVDFMTGSGSFGCGATGGWNYTLVAR